PAPRTLGAHTGEDAAFHHGTGRPAVRRGWWRPGCGPAAHTIAPVSPPPLDRKGPDPKKERTPGSGLPVPGSSWPRPVVWVLIGVALLALVAAPYASRTNADKIDYSTFRSRVEAGQVASVKVTNDSSRIKGKYTAPVDSKTEFTTTAPASI